MLHSTISPLTPSAPIFPDGIVTPLWIIKHQELLPAAFLACFPLTSDPNTSSLRDNQLKTEINNIRNAFGQTNYKTKLMVIFLCDDGEETPYDLDDRLSIIRRATGLDSKTSFFISPESTVSQIDDFLKTILGILQPMCVEYYRDLSKHARRKRNRGSPPLPTAPPNTGTLKTLSQQGWNVRYEFKLGVFAEFRQEMDAACRNFESAYDGLLAPELFETIPSWSPRFNDARMLADAIAIRIIRCLLWTGQTTAAVRSWRNHRNRIRDFVVRRGKGTRNYGWEAWEASWSKTMAQLVDRAGIMALNMNEQLDPNIRKTGAIFCLPEKSIPIGERISPWDLLHHQGYWLDESQKHTRIRRWLAHNIPEEDRTPPGQSPASVIASKVDLYDTYLAPPPNEEVPLTGEGGYNHSEEIINTIRNAITFFSTRRQFRMVERLYLQLGQQLMAANLHEDALQILKPIWTSLSWREAGWWMLANEVGWAIHDCAQAADDSETLLRVVWELYCDHFIARTGFQYDVGKSLSNLQSNVTKPAVVLKAENVCSPLVPSFAFLKPEGHVGENFIAQLAIRSRAHSQAAPICCSEVKVVFEGGLKPLRLTLATESEVESNNLVALSTVQLHDPLAAAESPSQSPQPEGISPLVGTANLTFSSGVTRIFELAMIPREIGEAKIDSITIIVDDETFHLTSVTSGAMSASSKIWYRKSDRVISRPIGTEFDGTMASIMPKPPKLAIRPLLLRKTYYTDEDVCLDFEITNEEDEAVSVNVEAIIRCPDETDALAQWKDSVVEPTPFTKDEEAALTSSSKLPTRKLGVLESVSSNRLSLGLIDSKNPAQYEVMLTAQYYLVSDPHTPVSKELVVTIPLIRPFEVSYDFVARLDGAPWPDFFSMPHNGLVDADYEGRRQGGLRQKYDFVARIVSFATDSLVVDDVNLVTDDTTGDALCRVTAKETSEKSQERIVAPGEPFESIFDVLVVKEVLADRRQVGVDFALQIKWHRVDNTTMTTSILDISRFLIPMGEPRVLLTKAAAAEEGLTNQIPGLVTLNYTLENPSMHFLTFSLTMESSEDFAFSGPKSTTLNLVPLSRHTVTYRLIATRKDINARENKGSWLRPNLVVVDQGFRKQLRIIAAGEGVNHDKKSVMVWVT